jgi:hypothetical protein
MFLQHKPVRLLTNLCSGRSSIGTKIKGRSREGFRLILLIAAGLSASDYFIAVTCLPRRDL